MYILVVIWCVLLGLVIIYMNTSPIWGIFYVPIVWLQVKRNTFCWLRSLVLLKRIRLIIILYWMEYTFQIQKSLLKNWNCVKFIEIMIRTFNQIKNFKRKIFSNLSHINIHYHLRLGAPPLHRQFFIKFPQNRDFIQIFCNDRRNTFHFSFCMWSMVFIIESTM